METGLMFVPSGNKTIWKLEEFGSFGCFWGFREEVCGLYTMARCSIILPILCSSVFQHLSMNNDRPICNIQPTPGIFFTASLMTNLALWAGGTEECNNAHQRNPQSSRVGWLRIIKDVSSLRIASPVTHVRTPKTISNKDTVQDSQAVMMRSVARRYTFRLMNRMGSKGANKNQYPKAIDETQSTQKAHPFILSIMEGFHPEGTSFDTDDIFLGIVVTQIFFLGRFFMNYGFTLITLDQIDFYYIYVRATWYMWMRDTALYIR